MVAQQPCGCKNSMIYVHSKESTSWLFFFLMTRAGNYCSQDAKMTEILPLHFMPEGTIAQLTTFAN